MSSNIIHSLGSTDILPAASKYMSGKPFPRSTSSAVVNGQSIPKCSLHNLLLTRQGSATLLKSVVAKAILTPPFTNRKINSYTPSLSFIFSAYSFLTISIHRSFISSTLCARAYLDLVYCAASLKCI